MWLIGGTLSFNGPNAFQVRNAHSYYSDFTDEQSMYLKTEKLVRFLADWKCDYSRFYECMIDLSRRMATAGFWKTEEVDGIKNWIRDLTALGYVEPVIVNEQVNCISIIFGKYFLCFLGFVLLGIRVIWKG